MRNSEAWEAQQAWEAAQKNGKDDRENEDANTRDNTRENEVAYKRAPAHSNVVTMAKPVNYSEAVDIAICKFSISLPCIEVQKQCLFLKKILKMLIFKLRFAFCSWKRMQRTLTHNNVDD
jgi:hypothetical protein